MDTNVNQKRTLPISDGENIKKKHEKKNSYETIISLVMFCGTLLCAFIAPLQTRKSGKGNGPLSRIIDK